MLTSIPFLLGGFLNTLILTAASGLVAGALAIAVGTARFVGPPALGWALAAYVELFRGTSLLLQLFWLYFVLPLLGVDLPAMAAAILGIGLNYGAYGSESVRGALAVASLGQREAALALGLRPLRAFRLVILPQALPVMIQPLGVLAVQLLKATSLASLVTISELSFRAYQLNQVTSRTGLIFSIVLLLYFAAAQAIAALTRLADRRAGAWRRVGRLAPAA